MTKIEITDIIIVFEYDVIKERSNHEGLIRLTRTYVGLTKIQATADQIKTSHDLSQKLNLLLIEFKMILKEILSQKATLMRILNLLMKILIQLE